jgi:hypothetical protein
MFHPALRQAMASDWTTVAREYVRCAGRLDDWVLRSAARSTIL